jgi:hypothetical protein
MSSDVQIDSLRGHYCWHELDLGPSWNEDNDQLLLDKPDKQGVTRKYMPLYGFQQDRRSVVQLIVWLFSRRTKATSLDIRLRLMCRLRGFDGLHCASPILLKLR